MTTNYTKPNVFVITCRSEDGQHYAEGCSDEDGISGLGWVQLLAHADRFLHRREAEWFRDRINRHASPWRGEASIVEVTNDQLDAAEKRAEELDRLAEEEEKLYNELFDLTPDGE